MPFQDFLATVERIPSLGSRRHSRLLYGLIGWLRPRVIVEVGSFRGYTTCHLARGLQDNGGGTLYAIDDFSMTGHQEEFEELRKNLVACGVEGCVKVINGNSREVEWPAQVDMAFIDGDHSYQGCRIDFESAYGLGATCIALHDTSSWWGPRRWLSEFRERARDWDCLEVGFDEGFAVCLKRGTGPLVYSEAIYSSGDVAEAK